MNIAVIIVAGGSGVRAGGEIPKQYRHIGGRAVLAHTLDAFSDFQRIVIVRHPDHDAWLSPILKAYPKPVTLAESGTSRTLSVKSGLERLADDPPDYVLIHDAARPFVSSSIIEGVISALKTYDGAAPALPVIDAIKTDDFSPVDRSTLRAVQTPQGFKFSALWPLYENMNETANYADDIEVASSGGLSLTFTEGSRDNIKITFTEDFNMAEQKLSSGLTVAAMGFDVHRTEAGHQITLGGVTFDSPVSLVGHSDADVALHALTDAILGTIGAGDIGTHFPPTDPQWKGAPSDKFFKHAIDLVQEDGGALVHLDVTIICERPKVGPHREAIRESISALSGLPLKRVSVKATTTEKLGYTGRGEGIAAQACATVRMST